MTPMGVVPALDPGKDRCTSFLACPEMVSIEHFALQAGEEALGESVVVGVSHRAHRRSDPKLVTALAEGY